MTAASPGIVAAAMDNRHYAIARGLRARRRRARCATEYRYIVDQGLLLQIDAPDLAHGAPHAVRRPAARRVPRLGRARRSSAINDALTGIDPSNVRLHVCWGNYEGPHTLDVPLEGDPVACSTRRTSARWSSRWPTLATRTSTRCSHASRLPDGMVLVAGVIDTTSNYVEHQEVVADRLERVADAVGDPTRDHRRHRLRLRHVRRSRRRRAVARVGEAARAPRGRRPRDRPSLLTARLLPRG